MAGRTVRQSQDHGRAGQLRVTTLTGLGCLLTLGAADVRWRIGATRRGIRLLTSAATQFVPLSVRILARRANFGPFMNKPTRSIEWIVWGGLILVMATIVA